MPRYSIPVTIKTYIEIEADNLKDAYLEASRSDIKIESGPDDWDINDYGCIYKDDNVIAANEYDDLNFAEINNIDELKNF